MDYSLPGSSVHEFSRQEDWSGFPLLPQCYRRVPQWLTAMLEYWWFHYTSDIFHSTKNCSLLWEEHTLTPSTHTLLSNPHIPPKQTFTYPPLVSHPYTHSLAYHHIPTHVSSTHIFLSHTHNTFPPLHTPSSYTPLHTFTTSTHPHILSSHTSPQASHNHSSHIPHIHPLLYSQAQPYLTQHKYASSLLIPILAPSLPSPFPSSTLSPTHKHFPIYLNFNLSKAHWSPVSLMKFFGIHLPFDDFFFWSWISYSTGFQLFSHTT